ncbi:hypothetical protein [Herbidospora daliensis]|uniref:hypothetical protein n=1 Tax=Herbidospora daliensis TaxID=295585 RepID=UPI000781C744|nr:hypothetical protein [Herbidospora daliensis]
MCVFPDGRGTVYLTYNASTKKNRVVTLRQTPGAATFVEARIRRSGTTTWFEDSGTFTTYAGPVHLSAPGSCVDWGGTFGTHSGPRPHQLRLTSQHPFSKALEGDQ